MPERLPSFGLLHVLGVVIIGCVAFALFTDERLWMWVALAMAFIGCIWVGVIVTRDREESEVESSEEP